MTQTQIAPAPLTGQPLSDPNLPLSLLDLDPTRFFSLSAADEDGGLDRGWDEDSHAEGERWMAENCF